MLSKRWRRMDSLGTSKRVLRLFSYSYCIALSACIWPHLEEPDGCTPNPNVEAVESPHVCFNSLRCNDRNLVTFPTYFCVCSGNCLCFLSVTKDCDGTDPTKVCEKLSGGMFIFGGGFCSTEQSIREQMLLVINQETDRMLKESNERVQDPHSYQ